ncbi:MAG: GHKL domain-containing protein [Sedimentibacter sp.]
MKPKNGNRNNFQFLNVPEKLNFQLDIVIVIGNLVGNTIEATSKLKENKKINMSIEFIQNVIYISVF